MTKDWKEQRRTWKKKESGRVALGRYLQVKSPAPACGPPFTTQTRGIFTVTHAYACGRRLHGDCQQPRALSPPLKSPKNDQRRCGDVSIIFLILSSSDRETSHLTHTKPTTSLNSMSSLKNIEASRKSSSFFSKYFPRWLAGTSLHASHWLSLSPMCLSELVTV